MPITVDPSPVRSALDALDKHRIDRPARHRRTRKVKEIEMFIVHDLVDVFALVGMVRIGKGAWRRWHRISH
jgi:hypothetical protein